MDDARGGDNFIGRVAVEVQRVDGAANIQRKRPGLDSGQCSRQLRIIEVEFNAAQLREFAISQSTIPEILQVRSIITCSRGASNHRCKLCILSTKTFSLFEDIRPTIRDMQKLAQRRLRAP